MSRVRHASALLLLIALVLVTFGGIQSPAASSGGGHGAPAYVPGELLIKFRPAARAIDHANVRAQLNASVVHNFRSGAEHWRLGPGQSVEKAIERMQRNPHVQYAEPNYILTADVTPNDPRYAELYAMNNTGQTGGTADADIDADLAWGVSRGSRSVVVGVIDTGVDYNHPDLVANIWTNPGEIPGNGVDDDGNGFIDDVHGYDFVNNDGDPFDDNGHGTHVSGTIGALGNNGIGVVGVNWEVSIMALKFLSGAGSGSTADAVRAVEYATMMHVALTSNSWGGGGFDQTLYDAIAAAGAAEIPFIAAAGNDGVNNDTSPHYPSSFNLPSIISVAATDHNDAVASFSNYGAVSVDVAAPGVNILSTQPGGGYQVLSGTSMATPHVAGVAALLKSRFPNIPAAQIKFAIMNFSDQKPFLNPLTGSRPVASGGRLNAFFSTADPDNVAPGTIGDLATNNAGSNTMGLTWTATGDDGSSGTATFYQVRYSTSPIDQNNFNAATRAGNEPAPVASGGIQSMEVHGLAANTGYYFAIKAFDEWGNAGPISNIATGTTLPPPTAGYTPSSITDALLTGQQSDHTVTLRNDGAGTLDFTLPTPTVGTPLSIYPGLELDKDEPDPRSGILGSGGPDASGYRWVDSDEPGGPVFNWVEISSIGTPLPALNGDDQISNDIPIGFPFNFYGNTFSTVNVSTNGWFSFTNRTASGSITYSNQPLPNASSPENLVAPFWDDLDFRSAVHAYYYNDGSRFIVQWNDVDRHPSGEPPDPDHLTFQAILYPTGAIVYQYLSTNGLLDSTTVGIENGTRTDALTVVFNASYLHNNLAVEFNQIPQWLTASPASGRVPAGGSLPINVHLDASGLEGGTYPGSVNIQTNDPGHSLLTVDVSLHVTGAPDARVVPAALNFGDVFLALPFQRTLSVSNGGTDLLHVTSISASDTQITASPGVFNLAPRFGQNVTVTLTAGTLGPFSGSVTVHSDDASEPAITIPVTANVIPAPVVVANPTSFTDTLFSGNTSTHTLTVSNTGGSNLIVTATADQGITGTGFTTTDPSAQGQGGPDAFGYRWRDSDAAGGPPFSFVDISATGTPIAITGDDQISSTISMGMTFPFYGNTFSSLKVCTNGFVTFDPSTTACPFTNGALPSTSLPANSIAPFWDDLHFRGVQKARYLNDGTRFIVQYTDVDRVTAGSHLTFQVQLYPNGRILIMYQTMNSPLLTSATIGVQNQARNIALQVVNNAAYMHNNLALLISRTPDWLSVSPAGTTVPPGGSRDFSVRFDATDRTGGTLTGNIVLRTNVPGQETILLPATLHVIGAPNVRTVPTAFNYGTVYIGYPALTSFQVINDGTDVLDVSDIDVTDPTLTVEDLPGPTAGFTLTPGAARVMNLRWNPTVAGALSASVRVHSDDPDTPIALIGVTGSALVPPVAVSTPSSFNESLNVGDIVTRTLHLENHGGSVLTFGTSVRLLSGSPVPVYTELELKKDDPDPRAGILGNGGPDLFGYRWKDSDEPGGPSFAWTDISGIGTPIASLTSDDQIALNLPIGFTFPFYTGSFTTLNVNTNGWLSFTNTTGSGSGAFTNQPLPNSGTGVPENLLAAFWDDLDFRGAVHAYYHNDGTRFIVQFNNVDRHSTTAPSPAHLTFQAILYPNGRIVYQYLTMSGILNEATIGQQNSSRNDGLQVVFNSAYVHDNLAVEFRAPVDFLSLSPTAGSIPAGGSADISVRIDASSLIGGDYPAAIDLSTNDPARGLITVPLSLHVTGIPDVDLAPASLSFPTTYLGFGSSLPLTILNVGTDVLHVSGVSGSGDFAVSGLTPPFNLPPGGSVGGTVVFSPTVPGIRAGDITVSSDDPDEAIATIHAQGNALIPPEVNVAPAFVNTALPPGGTRIKTLTLSNTGGSDLHWTTGSNIISAVSPGSFVQLGKTDVDTRAGILGTGGPDFFGYRWTDSDETGGPVFDWTDISGVGTPLTTLTSDDQIALSVPIGFTFPYYGNPFSTVNVSTNGWMSFTNTTASGSASYTNQPLPNNGPGVPENLLAVFWDDLHFNGAVRAYYYNDGTRFILQYTHAGRFLATADYTFQAILYPSGKIVYQYLSMNGTLDSATIGTQNASRDDGLLVVFNAAYMHDGLAVEFRPIPEWVVASPSGGTLPAGGTQLLTLTLNAAGLDNGIHEATVDISSNDPYTPLLQVPVSLNVGLVAPTLFDFDPDVLNLQSNGRCVSVTIELPAGLDPHAINLSSLRLNDTVGLPPGPCSPPSFADSDNDGVEEIKVKFERAAVEQLFASMPAGNNTLTVQGEVADVQWFRGSTTVRTLRPSNIVPHGGEYLVTGGQTQITWTPPAGAANARYDIQLTRDGGSTWEVLASNLTTSSYTWTVGGAATSQARVRILVLDNQGLMGYGTSDADFTVATSLMPPNDVGDTLDVAADSVKSVLKWARPAADLTHGPAGFYRVMRSYSPQGPFVEIGTTTVESFDDPLAATAGAGIVYYQVLAANSGGNSAN